MVITLSLPRLDQETVEDLSCLDARMGYCECCLRFGQGKNGSTDKPIGILVAYDLDQLKYMGFSMHASRAGLEKT